MKTKICNTCCIEKPLSEFSSHATSSDKINPKCKECVSEYNKQYRKENKQRILENDRQYASKHRRAAKERTAKWMEDEDNRERKRKNDKRLYQQKKEIYAEQAAHRYEKNEDHIKQKAKQYRKENPGKVNANIAKRRANEKQATPKWADLQKIEEFYVEARRLTETAEVSYQVDHIIPLNSNVVCGLHCEDNLQILTAEENNRKNNKLVED